MKTSPALKHGKGLFNYAGLLMFGPPALEAYEASKGRRRERKEIPEPTKAQRRKANKQRQDEAVTMRHALRGGKRKKAHKRKQAAPTSSAQAVAQFFLGC